MKLVFKVEIEYTDEIIADARSGPISDLLYEYVSGIALGDAAVVEFNVLEETGE